MKRLTSLVCLSLLLFATLAMAAGDTTSRGDRVRHAMYGDQADLSASAAATKAAVDTIYLLGGPNRDDGDFEDGKGPSWDGWAHMDMSAFTAPHWQVSTWNNPGTGNGVWCGAYFEPCSETDPPEGYGNGWMERFDFYGTAPDPDLPTNVRVQALLNYDVEPDYDYVYLQVWRQSTATMENLLTFTTANKDLENVFTPVVVDQLFSVDDTDYIGENLDQIQLRWEMTSDTGWSDGDCSWPTYGACTLDDIVVSFNDVVVSTTDFEDDTTGDWALVYPPPVGDFSQVWPRLYDIDVCTENPTPQVAFIDDGVVVPGTGGTLGVTWTYGPSGYVVNLNGGIAGPGYRLHNRIESPAMDWPAGNAGAGLSYTIWPHMPSATYQRAAWWLITSTDGGVTWGEDNNNTVYYGGSAWGRNNFNVSVYAKPGANKVKVAMTTTQTDVGSLDATPGPYFDNLVFKVWPLNGPALSADVYYLLQDNFPEIGIINYADLGTNSVRVDIAANISNPLHLRNDPGDSTFCDVVPVRAGAVLNGTPTMHVRMKANPLFDTVRDPLPAGFTRTGNLIEGDVAGLPTYAGVALIKDRFNFDLPDTGFFFPGDVFHYYFRAEDNLAGDIGFSTLPGDTTGFSALPGMDGYAPMLYNMNFLVRALPSMRGTTIADQPKVLFWNDQLGYGADDEWYTSLAQLGYLQGVDYDAYTVKAPSSFLGNGLGGRASYLQVEGYRTMLYTSGTLNAGLIANGDFEWDPSQDVVLMTEWLDLGNKRFFATGDNLFYDMNRAGTLSQNFLTTFFKLAYEADDLRPLIDNQAAPVVAPIAGNALGLDFPFIAYGGCLAINRFDAVNIAGNGVKILEFLDPNGVAGEYTYAAGSLATFSSGTRVIGMPYDFQFIYDPLTKAPVDTPVRTKLLSRIMLYFGETSGSPATGTPPDAAVFSAKSYPNPFNPATKISYTLPRAGDVTIKIFNVQGELVRTVFSGASERDGWVEWDGTDSGGKNVASGVYFYQVKTSGHELFNKMTLLK